MRRAYLAFGYLALVLGLAGVVLPLIPTVPLVILAAFLFARSSPELERRIVEHPRFKPHFVAWRERGAISRRGKVSALAAFGASAILGFALLDFPLLLVPLAAALIGGSWIMSRPSA